MKRWLGMDVFTAARSRLEEVFDAFERVFVSFSGGKDSGVVVQLALDIAREKGRLPLDVLHIDLEAWYAHTDAFVTRIRPSPFLAILSFIPPGVFGGSPPPGPDKALPWPPPQCPAD